MVDVPGPPCVMILICPNTWKELIILVIKRKNVVGDSIGIVIRISLCHQFAPSISADSYSSLGIHITQPNK